MTSPDELRAELARVRGLTNTLEADRGLQELLADTFITISEQLAIPGALIGSTEVPDGFWQQGAAADNLGAEPPLAAALALAGNVLATQGIRPSDLTYWVEQYLSDDQAEKRRTQELADEAEHQMMDAVRPHEAGQTVVVEGVPEADREMGTVTGFGVTEGENYAVVDFPSSEGVRVWVKHLMVVTLERAKIDDDSDVEVGEAEGGGERVEDILEVAMKAAKKSKKSKKGKS